MKVSQRIALVSLLLTSFSAISQYAPAKATSERPAANAAPTRPPKMVLPDVATQHLVKKVSPAYPEEARKHPNRGTKVIMRVRISAKGDVKELKVLQGDPLFATPAMEAVKQWKYKPFIFAGQPVEIESWIVLNVDLVNDSRRASASPR